MAADLLSKIRLEIDERLSELRPLLVEHERLLGAVDALKVAPAEVSLPARAVAKSKTKANVKIETKAKARAKAETETKTKRAGGGIARETILAALDHGSHTVTELAMVTATSAPSINASLRKLLAEGAIVKTEREGKVAWARPDAP